MIVGLRSHRRSLRGSLLGAIHLLHTSSSGAMETSGGPRPHQPLVTRVPSSINLRSAASSAVEQHGFRVPAAAVQQLQASMGCSMDTLLLSFLQPASELARPPISNYYVGAAALAGSGAVYLGVNLEFKGTPLSQSVHAEQFLLANLLLHGEQELLTLAISAAPCGHCRQFYSELWCADAVRFVFGDHEHAAPQEYTLQQLLPSRFGPEDLLADPAIPRLLQPQRHALEWAPAAQQLLAARRDDAEFQEAARVALAAAQQSYSPYNRCPSGVALLLEGGRALGGGYIENAAHNPGLPPLQAAIVAAVVAGVPSCGQVKELVLVEREDGGVQQAVVVPHVARVATGKPDLPVALLPVRLTA